VPTPVPFDSKATDVMLPAARPVPPTSGETPVDPEARHRSGPLAMDDERTVPNLGPDYANTGEVSLAGDLTEPINTNTVSPTPAVPFSASMIASTSGRSPAQPGRPAPPKGASIGITPTPTPVPAPVPMAPPAPSRPVPVTLASPAASLPPSTPVSGRVPPAPARLHLDADDWEPAMETAMVPRANPVRQFVLGALAALGVGLALFLGFRLALTLYYRLRAPSPQTSPGHPVRYPPATRLASLVLGSSNHRDVPNLRRSAGGAPVSSSTAPVVRPLLLQAAWTPHVASLTPPPAASDARSAGI
jgi:hypothetical protein